MTEEEAKLKWCPFARAASAIGPVAVNRMETSLTEDGSIADPDCLCLAAGCMMWRWRGPHDEKRGYCGLAS